MLNRVIGPIPKNKNSGVQINRFGVIPKNHQTGKWRIMVGLSSPDKASINDTISQELCSLSYVSVDDVVRLVLELGQGSMLTKLDIQTIPKSSQNSTSVPSRQVVTGHGVEWTDKH